MKRSVTIAAALIALTALLFSGCGGAEQSSTADTVILLVRHGQTQGNIEQLMQGGRSDSPLTEEGKQTVAKLGAALANVHIDRAYSSELGRAKTTEQLIFDENKAGSVKMGEAMAAFNDIDWGNAEDRPRSEVEAEYGPLDEDTYFGSAEDPSFVTPTGGESKYQFCERFGKGIDEILSKDIGEKGGGTILLTAHSSAVFYLRQRFPEDSRVSGLENASLTVIRIHDGKWELLDESDTDYSAIPDKLKKWRLIS